MGQAGVATKGFRTDIEGLRGVCVLAVVFYHAFPQWVSGGFVGVDVFFVISGYLITRLLLNELRDTGRVDLLGFWQRRIRRILPVATFVLCAVSLAVLLFPILDARALGRHIAAAALFYHNIKQARSATDYLGDDHEDNPLLHYWSLSVEEQFYVVWPVLILLAVSFIPSNPKTQWKLLAGFAIGLLAASFAYSVYLTGPEPSWAFFGTPTRAWQLLAGAVLAIIEPHIRLRHNGANHTLGLLALGILLGCFVLISDAYPYPGWAASLPTFAAAALIFANQSQQSLAGVALGNEPLRFAGRISFSWYLWHWPLLVFGRLAFGDTTTALLAAIAISFLLAIATYYVIEQPVRRAPLFAQSRRHAYALGAGLIAAGALTGIGLRHLAPDRVHIGNGVYVSGAQIKNDRPRIYADRCLIQFAETKSPPCIYGAPNAKKTVVLLGDSHAANWFEPLELAARREGWRLLVRTKASCRPIDTAQTASEGGRKRPYVECEQWLRTTLAEIEAVKPDLIVVAGTRHRFDISAETRVIRKLSVVSRTIVMRDTPLLPEDALKCLREKQDPDQCKWPLRRAMGRRTYPRTPTKDLPENAEVLDLNRSICPNGVCSSVLDGQIVMFDAQHLTASFSRQFAGEFQEILSGAAR